MTIHITNSELEHLRAAYLACDPERRQGGSAFSQLLVWLEQTKLTQTLEIRKCTPGEVIMEEHTQGDLCYLIDEGQAAVVKGNFASPTVLGFRGEGDAIGEMALLENRPRSASIIALSDTTLWILSREMFYQFLSQNPAFSLNLMNMLSWRIRESDIERQRVTELEKQQRKTLSELEEKASKDGLTGLYNRRYLDQVLPDEIASAEQDSSSVGIIMTDVDHFKKVNDTYGHHAGDVVLRAVANLLKQNVRTTDIVCRYGGEEFVIILPGANIPALKRSAEEIRQQLEATIIETEGQEIRCTLSLGLACYPKHGSNSIEILQHADQALYIAKRTGRNRFVVYDPSQNLPAEA